VKILILSFYYPPDLSAGSFRVIALVNALMNMARKDIQIEVITTQPNRYQGFGMAVDDEKSERLKIHRIKIPEHNSGMLDQAKSFLFYAHETQKILKSQQYDFVFASSSRLMTAALGACISRWKKIPLYLDIRDIFVDTIQDVLPRKSAYILTPMFSLIEHFTIGRATQINLVSPGFESYFKRRYPRKSFSYFMNGIDEVFIPNNNVRLKNINYAKEMSGLPVRILYAGNVGEGQGLHKIIPMLAKKLGRRVIFRLIGGGGRLKELQSALNLIGVNNVEVVLPMARTDLIREYEAADVLFLHLNNYAAFEKVLPSKIFEYAALGKPILAGVSGYAAEFLSQEVLNSAIFMPCDVDGAVEAFESLSIQFTRREKFIEKYLRKNIMKNLAEDMVSRFEGK
jgi:glycosyltransferase involved in cell wall biosynthesis